jgi:hypothetical protein
VHLGAFGLVTNQSRSTHLRLGRGASFFFVSVAITLGRRVFMAVSRGIQIRVGNLSRRLIVFWRRFMVMCNLRVWI